MKRFSKIMLVTAGLACLLTINQTQSGNLPHAARMALGAASLGVACVCFGLETTNKALAAAYFGTAAALVVQKGYKSFDKLTGKDISVLPLAWFYASDAQEYFGKKSEK